MPDYPSNSVTPFLLTARRTLLRRTAVSLCLRFFGCLGLAIMLLQCLARVAPVRATTAGMLVLILGAVAAGGLLAGLVWKLLRLPDTAGLAGRVERIHPEFKDALICAAELERRPASEFNPVEQALHAQVLERFSRVHLLASILPVSLTSRRLLVEGLLVVALCAVAMRMPIWDKALYAWGIDSEAGLIVAPGDAEIPEGSDLPVEARILRWEKKAVIEMRSGNERLSYDMHPGQDGFSFTFYGVTAPFDYRVLTPSVAGSWYRVETYSPPEILQVKIELVPPAYTGEPAVTLDELQDTSVLEGTTCEFYVATNVPAQLWLELEEERLPFEGKTGEQLNRQLVLQADRERTFRIGMRDAVGRENHSRTMTVSVFPDAVPNIEVLSPEPEAIALPDAAVFMQARVIDDYGLQAVRLHVSVGGRFTKVFSLYESGGDEDVVVQQQLALQELGARAGEVIAYYFSADDGKTPAAQTGRSEVRFVEVRPEIKPNDIEGIPQEKKNVDINRILAELRRLIRLSYDLQRLDKENSDKALELVTGLSDLRTLIVGEMDKIKAEAAAGDGSEVLLAWFQKGVGEVEQARTFARINTFDQAIQSEERALSTFTRIAQELMKNQSSKPSPESKGEQGQASQEQAQEKSKQISLADALKQLREMQQQMRHLADRQGAQNQRVGRSQGASGGEREELAGSQKELSDKTAAVRKQIAESGFLRELSEQVGQAQTAMDDAESRVREGDMRGGERSGERAQRELLAAIEKADQAAREIASRQISELARQFSRLAEGEGKLSDVSRQAAAQEHVDKKTRDAMRDAQKKVGDKTDEVMRNAEAVSRELSDIFPAAGDALEEAIRKAASQNLQGQMKKAENALLYGRMGRAAQFQKQAADDMTALAQTISLAGDKLPRISTAELLKALARISQASEQAKSGREGARQAADGAAETLTRLGRQLDDLQLMELSGRLGALLDEESGPRSMLGAARLLDQSVAVLREHLMRLHIDQREELIRKMAQPPPKYRKQVEEYFKELSEGQ